MRFETSGGIVARSEDGSGGGRDGTMHDAHPALSEDGAELVPTGEEAWHAAQPTDSRAFRTSGSSCVASSSARRLTSSFGTGTWIMKRT